MTPSNVLFCHKAHILHICSSASSNRSAFCDSLAFNNWNSVCSATPDIVLAVVDLTPPILAILFMLSVFSLMLDIICVIPEPLGSNKNGLRLGSKSSGKSMTAPAPAEAWVPLVLTKLG